MDDNICCICWETLSDNISVLRCCPIRSYHASCLANWNKISKACPFCRVEHIIDVKPEPNYFEQNDIINEQIEQKSLHVFLGIIMSIFIGCLIIFIIIIV